MRTIPMLTAIALFCTTACRSGENIHAFDPSIEKMVISTEDGKLIARIGDLMLPARDCSTPEIRCIDISEKFFFAYPRRCPTPAKYELLRWRIEGVETFFSAPYPDSAMPDGVYMSTLSDRIAYDYDIKNGLTNVIIANNSVSSGKYNLGDYERSFVVSFPKGDFNNFRCDKSR